MFKQVKPENISEYVRKVEYIFPEFTQPATISIANIKKYYSESFWGYALFHSWSGAIHMALSESNHFSKNDYFRQAEEIGEALGTNGQLGPKRVLEVGCGRGFNIAYLARRFPNTQFLGVDLNDQNVHWGRKGLNGLANARIEAGDFHELAQIPDASIDVVFAVETLCHADDLERALKAISRVLKVGGRFVVYDGFRAPSAPVDATINRAVVYTERAMAVPAFPTAEGFSQAAIRSGLALESEEDRSSEIMPNLIRLSDLAKAFFKVPPLSKLLLIVLPRGLATNAVAGLLMAVTVQLGAHKYLKLSFVKAA